MRSLLDREDEDGKSSEITLSTASLLGIFFGLVLVCGVFFGFGYSMGRGVQPTRPALATAEPATPVVADNTSATPAAEQPELQEDLPPAPKPTPPPVIEHPKPVEDALATADTPKPALPKKPNAAKPIAADPPMTTAVNMPPTAGTGQPMVQIAAVARREDADVLVTALRQRGYGVVVRNEPQDKLLHVQVGPFADRVQATAIKQKLLSDGYNAIIKQ